MQNTTFDSTKAGLMDLLGQAASGKTQLPDFQRGWVWDDEHIRDLLASVSRSFPIGAVMLLEAGGDDVTFKTRQIEGADTDNTNPEHLVLDGQQRLTSLFQSLLSAQPVATRDPKGKPLHRWYYLDIVKALDENVERIDAIFGVPQDRILRSDFGRQIELDLSTREQEFAEQRFPFAQLVNYREWRREFNRYWDHDRDKTVLLDRFEEEVLDPFLQFQIPVIALKKQVPKEAVCLVFEKVNTGGVSLTVFELLTATFAADNFELRPDWDARQARMHELPVLHDVASTDFLQAATLLSTYEARRQAAGDEGESAPAVSCKRRDILRLTSDRYLRWADELEAGFRQAARFLNRESIYDVKFLPYSSQLVPLAALFTILGKRAEDQGVHDRLVRWYWCGVFGELYGSATETRFARDLPDVVTWIEGGPTPRTIDDANFAPERLLTLQTRRSAAYRGLYVMLLREGARDFRTGESSTLQTYFDEAIDIHHIFPRKWCSDRDVEARLYDSIINKTPLTARTNRIIGGNAPSTYLSSLERNHDVPPGELDANLRSHLIEPSTMREDDFETFFRSRSEALLGTIAKGMGKGLEHDPAEDWLPEITYQQAEAEPDLSEPDPPAS